MYSNFREVVTQLKMNQVHIYITTECSQLKEHHLFFQTPSAKN